MTTKEKVTGILERYFNIRDDVEDFEILKIQNNMVDVSFIATGKGFADSYINIQSINFKNKEIVGIIDIELVQLYVQNNVENIEISK